eukprot:CAMPEP_0113517312 /NCGR_PEP_ID=MMETSP0014_2-20120614/42166_1 /TAXON_ID=2857 /ORGANISM="Nitzschia sp." /LENGTH=294 /DNA_ID=CAMNT_0000414449 /DNA_START=121 /DNA_END=1005 /DNA_ORIENTATION=- /assembly_acc=CAM_ASM_000159
MISIRSMSSVSSMSSSSLLLQTVAKKTKAAATATQGGQQLQRRFIASPAYRRHLLKKKQQQEQYAKILGGSQIPTGFQKKSSAFSVDSTAKPVDHQVPTIEESKEMPTGFSELGNDALLTIAEMGNHTARIEVLKRHIMAVDNVDYQEATKTFKQIAEKNREGVALASLPYKIGITTALVAGFGAIPMVFEVNLAMWFNEGFVTMDIPEPNELDTPLEVGAWTWNWMEPAIGTASFVLLCLQFSREQMKNLGVQPYTVYLKKRRAKMLAKSFPKYDAGILQEFVETDPMITVKV